jgi:4-hydroxy-tetrahydrodipicolinate synthase
MATPFTSRLTLDLDGAQRLAAHLAENGSDGLVVCGTTGESPTLTHAETIDLLRAVVEAVGDRVSVIAGTGKNDTAATVALTAEVERLGVDGVLVVTPYYNRPSQRGLLGHFAAVAEATSLPVLLYDIPGRTGRAIEADTILRLASEVPNIVGVKDAAGDLVKTARVASQAPDLLIYSGDDAATLPILAVGGVGVISVASHLVGRDFSEMIRSFPTDPCAAKRIHHRLLPLFETLMTADPSPGPLKAALGLLGLPGGPVRPPLADPDDDVVEKVRGALTTAGVKQ